MKCKCKGPHQHRIVFTDVSNPTVVIRIVPDATTKETFSKFECYERKNMIFEGVQKSVNVD
jgi:hypothetical protein